MVTLDHKPLPGVPDALGGPLENVYLLVPRPRGMFLRITADPRGLH